MAAADLKSAQAIAHAAATVVENAVGEIDRLVSIELERSHAAEARRLGVIGEALSREAERLRGV